MKSLCWIRQLIPPLSSSSLHLSALVLYPRASASSAILYVSPFLCPDFINTSNCLRFGVEQYDLQGSLRRAPACLLYGQGWHPLLSGQWTVRMGELNSLLCDLTHPLLWNGLQMGVWGHQNRVVLKGGLKRKVRSKRRGRSERKARKWTYSSSTSSLNRPLILQWTCGGQNPSKSQHGSAVGIFRPSCKAASERKLTGPMAP